MFGSSMMGHGPPCRKRREETSGDRRGSHQTPQCPAFAVASGSAGTEHIGDPHLADGITDRLCTRRIASRCRGDSIRSEKSGRGKVNESAGEKLWKRRAKAPLAMQERFPLSHSFNNNSLTIASTSQKCKNHVASPPRLLVTSRHIESHHSGMLIDHGIPTLWNPQKLKNILENQPAP